MISDSPSKPYFFFKIYLLVTGKAEAQHLPKLFKRFEQTGYCKFLVLRRISQHRPRLQKTNLHVAGTQIRIPNKMQEEISLPVRSCLRRGEDTYLLLIDDLESSGRASVEEIFKNYRRAVDLLLAAEEKSRTAVFFLVNMLEAYFFADPEAIHRALGIQAEISVGDVEKIRNPKSRLAMQYPGYRETEDGGRILEQLDLFKVLENPKHCAWLRSCIDWVYRSLSRDLAVELQDSLENIEQACHLQDGRKSIQTSAQ